MQLGGIVTAVAHGDLHDHVLGCGLGVLHERVEIAAFVEDAGIHSSCSGSPFPGAWLVSTRSAQGYSACGYLYSMRRYDEVGVASR
jgi:hypothetical protein